MRVQVSDATARASLRDSSDYGLQYLRDAQSADSKLDSNITLGTSTKTTGGPPVRLLGPPDGAARVDAG